MEVLDVSFRTLLTDVLLATQAPALPLPLDDSTAGAIAILSAMITPAVLILATGSLLLTTAQRLARAMDRVRRLADRLGGENLFEEAKETSLSTRKRRILADQVLQAAKRARLLQRSMICLYLALALFVGTSITIGLVEVLNLLLMWVPISLGLTGSCLLLYASIVLINESRIALSAVNLEMDMALHEARQNSLPPGVPRRKRRKPPPTESDEENES